MSERLDAMSAESEPTPGDSQPAIARIFKGPQDFRSSPEYQAASKRSEFPFASFLFEQDDDKQPQGSDSIVIPPKG